MTMGAYHQRKHAKVEHLLIFKVNQYSVVQKKYMIIMCIFLGVTKVARQMTRMFIC